MRRSAAPVLLVTFLLATAGCSLPFGPDGAPDGGPDDGTEEPVLSAGEAPPGVSAEELRLTDPDALLSAHAETLVASGFETDIRTNGTVYQAGQVRRVERRQRVTVAADRDQYVYRVINPESQIDVWANRSMEAIRAQSGEQVNYRTNVEPATGTTLSGAALLDGCIDDSFVVEDVDRGGEDSLVVLASEELPDDRCVLTDDAEDVRNYEARAVVDERGRILQFVVSADYTIRDEEGSMELTFEIVRTSVDRFDRPEWVDEALSSQ